MKTLLMTTTQRWLKRVTSRAWQCLLFLNAVGQIVAQPGNDTFASRNKQAFGHFSHLHYVTLHHHFMDLHGRHIFDGNLDQGIASGAVVIDCGIGPRNCGRAYGLPDPWMMDHQIAYLDFVRVGNGYNGPNREGGGEQNFQCAFHAPN